MASTFQARCQTYLGTGYTETTLLSDNLTAGAKYVTDLIRPEKLDQYSADLTDSGSGVTTSAHRIIGAHKGGYRASRIDPKLKTQSLPSGALSTVAIVSGGTGYALNDVLTLSQGTSGTCTVTAVSGGVVTAIEITTAGSAFTLGVKTTSVAPTGGSGCTIYVIPTNSSIYEATTTDPIFYIEKAKGYVLPGGGTIVGVAYPTVAYGDTSISSFPTELDQAVVLYAVIQGCLDLINDNRVSLNALTYATLTAPTAPLDSSYSYTDATLGTYTSTTIGSLGAPPTYTKPTISLTTAPIDFALAIGTVAPTAPADSSYSYADATLGTYTATTIGSLGTPPTYTKPTISLTSAPADLAFSINVVAPTTPNAPAYSYTDATLGTYSATTIGSLGTAPTYTKPTTTFSVTNATTYIGTAEDLEKAQTELQMQNALLNQYNQDISNELNEFNKEAEVYKSTFQTAIKQAELDQERLMLSASKTTDLSIQNKAQTLSKDISVYKDTLQKFAEDLQLYQQNVNKEVELYKTNLEKWVTQRNNEIQQYNLDIQNEQNEFVKELETYKSTVQNAIRQAELDQERLMLNASKTTDLSIQNKAQTLNKDISLYKDKLQRLVEQIDLFNAQVNSEIQVYKTNLEKWQTQRSTELQQYSGDIQNEVNEYQKELAVYQSTVQNAIRQAELDQERLMLTANKTTDLSIQNKAQTLNASIQLFKDKLEKFAGQIQNFGQQIQDASVKYNLDQQKYNAQINHFQLLYQGVKKEFEDYLKGRV